MTYDPNVDEEQQNADSPILAGQAADLTDTGDGLDPNADIMDTGPLQSLLAKKRAERDTLGSDYLTANKAAATAEGPSREQLIAGAIISALPYLGGVLAKGKEGLGAAGKASAEGGKSYFANIDDQNKDGQNEAKATAQVKAALFKDASTDTRALEIENAKQQGRESLYKAKHGDVEIPDDEKANVAVTIHGMGGNDDDVKEALKNKANYGTVIKRLKDKSTIESQDTNRQAETERRDLDATNQGHSKANDMLSRIAPEGLRAIPGTVPTPKDAEASKGYKQAYKQLDNTLSNLESAIKTGDKAEQFRYYNQAIDNIKQARGYGANFTIYEQALAAAGLPQNMDSMTPEKLSSYMQENVYRGSDPLKDVANSKRAALQSVLIQLQSHNYYMPGSQYDPKSAKAARIPVDKKGNAIDDDTYTRTLLRGQLRPKDQGYVNDLLGDSKFESFAQQYFANKHPKQ